MKIVKEALSDVFQPKSKEDLSMQLRPGANFHLSAKSTYGTSGAGVLNASYIELKKLFGKPEIDEHGYKTGYKIRINWDIEDEEGKVYSIYDWKASKYTIKEIMAADSFRWHISTGAGDAEQLKIWIAVNV